MSSLPSLRPFHPPPADHEVIVLSSDSEEGEGPEEGGRDESDTNDGVEDVSGDEGDEEREDMEEEEEEEERLEYRDSDDKEVNASLAEVLDIAGIGLFLYPTFNNSQ